MKKKYFTLEEANNLLPTLEKELKILQKLQSDFQYKLKQLNKIKELNKSLHQTTTNEIFTSESELEFLELQAQLHIQNIQSTGAQLKGIDMGLLDFPAFIKDKEVLLCWKEGEEKITHYHEAHEGFNGRKLL